MVLATQGLGFCAVCARDAMLGVDGRGFCSQAHMGQWLRRHDPETLAEMKQHRAEGHEELARMRAAGETAQEIAMRRVIEVMRGVAP